MPKNYASPVCIQLPLPPSAYSAMAALAMIGTVFLVQDYLTQAVIAWIMTLLLLPIGQKFELDGAGRYRDGWNWAHWLNPAWQPLPAVQHVLVKPHRYRKLPPSQFIGGLTDEGTWEGYTVLLSVPNSRLGVVVASVKDEVEAEAIAAEVAGALQLPWQRV